jgi:hypothetical protein
MALETPLWIQSGSFSSLADRTLIDTAWTAGVLDAQAAPTVNPPPGSTDLKVAPNATVLAVDVAAGSAIIAGGDQTRQGKYVCRNNAVTTVAIAPRPATGLSRLDLVYAQVVDTSAGIGGTDGWYIQAATGVPSGSSPALPALPVSSIPLAQVNVAAGTNATFATTDITDLRVRARSRLPKQGFDPVVLSWVGPAASVVGQIGLILFTIGPYPCKWIADMTYHCAVSGQALNMSVSHGLPGNVWTILTTDRVNPAGGYSMANCRYIWQENDGAQVQFRTEAIPTVGGQTGAIYNDQVLHRLDALVHLCP